MILVGGLVIALAGEKPAALWIMAATFVIVGMVVLWFNRLSVSVGNGDVKAHFGPGWPCRIFPTRDIIGFCHVRNKWYYGWGMRRLPSGWMFNVWGLDAVELEFADGGEFRIRHGRACGLARGSERPHRTAAGIVPTSSGRRPCAFRSTRGSPLPCKD